MGLKERLPWGYPQTCIAVVLGGMVSMAAAEDEGADFLIISLPILHRKSQLHVTCSQLRGGEGGRLTSANPRMQTTHAFWGTVCETVYGPVKYVYPSVHHPGLSSAELCVLRVYTATWLENVIFALAPLGILTAIVGAIRVGGPSWLKAIVGRARENRATVELELMSSTSHEVCELWNGQGVVRTMGRPEVKQIIYIEALKDTDTFGLYTVESAIEAGVLEVKCMCILPPPSMYIFSIC